MKKIREYWFNDGLDGIVAAKSLKHAAKKIAKEYGEKTDKIIKDIKEEWNGKEYRDWFYNNTSYFGSEFNVSPPYSLYSSRWSIILR